MRHSIISGPKEKALGVKIKSICNNQMFNLHDNEKMRLRCTMKNLSMKIKIVG